VDVIGVCRSSNEPVNITSRAGKELTKREISLVDQTGTEVRNFFTAVLRSRSRKELCQLHGIGDVSQCGYN
jgi:hypothetical protein